MQKGSAAGAGRPLTGRADSTRCFRATATQRRQGKLRQIIGDDLLKPAPQGKRPAAAASGTGIPPRLQAGNGDQRSLHQLKYRLYPVLLRGAVQAVAAALSPRGGKQAALYQLLYHNLQIFL